MGYLLKPPSCNNVAPGSLSVCPVTMSFSTTSIVPVDPDQLPSLEGDEAAAAGDDGTHATNTVAILIGRLIRYQLHPPRI